MYELILFNNIFVQLFKSSFCFFFLVFPSNTLSATFDIQIDLKIKHPNLHLQAHSEAYSEPCQTSKVEAFASIAFA